MKPYFKGVFGSIRMTGFTFLFCFLSFFYNIEGYGQESPKIGLVLSGGGAKGLAHIGILKALEEAGITPDYITGTSMGSIMGGLYSIGYTADQIKEIALSAEWGQLLSNKMLLSDVGFEEKSYYKRYLYELDVNNFDLTLPRGLIEGQKLSMLLSDLCRPVQNITDFNQFPIPFACIAADIETGERVVLRNGSLPRSMRASMAIPSVFTPVLMDDRLLVDGGLVHNLPVDENLEMGADYIIGVFVGTPLLKKEEMGSPVSVLTQAAFILSAFDNEKQKQLVDLYIEPELEGNGGADFDKAEEIIAIGEKYGKIYLPQFKILRDSFEALGWKPKKVKKPEVRDKTFINHIIIQNNDWVSDEFIKSRLGISAPSYISIDELEEGITQLYGSGYFSKILYHLKDSPFGTFLFLDVSETSKGKLRFGIHHDRETGPSLLLNAIYRNLLLQNSRILIEGEIADNPGLDINYLKYLGYKQKFAWTLGHFRNNFEVPSIDEGKVSGMLKLRYAKSYLSFHSTPGRNDIYSLTYSIENAQLKPTILSEDLRYINKIQFNSYNLEFRFNHNDMNDLYFPTFGDDYGLTVKYSTYADLKTKYQLADSLESFTVSTHNRGGLFPAVHHSMVRSPGKRISLGLTNALYFDLIDRNDSMAVSTNVLSQNYIGGFRKLTPNIHPFWGAEPVRYYSENLFYNELFIRYEFANDFFLKLQSQYFHSWFPMGLFYSDLREEDYDLGGKPWLFGLGASIAFRSPFGPVSLSAGKGSTEASWQYFINVGFYFDRY